MSRDARAFFLEAFGATYLNQPRMSTERPYEIFGHPSWPKEASRKGERALSEAEGRVCAIERMWP